MEPELVNRELVQYLALSSGHQRVKVEQEDLEWPLLLVAQELQMILKTRGEQWEIPLFERIVAPAQPLKLLIPLPLCVTWNDYDMAIKKSLKRRRDFWVVQIRFERLLEGRCLQFLHRGSYSAISESNKAMRQYARENGLALSDSCHEIFLNDAEETPVRDLQTLLVIPLQRSQSR
jgi:hypothetical protein